VLPLFLIAVMGLFGYLASNLLHQYEDLIAAYTKRSNQVRMIHLSESLDRYIKETGLYPASMNAFQSVAGYEQTAGLMNSWQGYAVSPAIVDANWTFKRMVLFANDPTIGVTQADYLAANHCGSGGYDTALSWCGSQKSMWYSRDERDDYQAAINNDRARTNRLSKKFVEYSNGYSTYPTLDKNNLSLGTNSLTSLATLAGYTGTASNCTGQYQYQGIPIDCSDMFNGWGKARAYQFFDSSHVMIVSETPIINASGTPVIISVDLT